MSSWFTLRRRPNVKITTLERGHKVRLLKGQEGYSDKRDIYVIQSLETGFVLARCVETEGWYQRRDGVEWVPYVDGRHGDYHILKFQDEFAGFRYAQLVGFDILWGTVDLEQTFKKS